MSADTPRDLVGRDLARVRIKPGRSAVRSSLGWLIVVCLTCALAVVALRIDILRVRYALAEAIGEEKALLQQQGQHAVQLEMLRNPARLSALAHAQGFERPERILELRTDPAGESTR